MPGESMVGAARAGSDQSGSVEDQPQCPGHSSNPNARSLSHSPSAPPPSFTQSTYPPRSLVRVGRLVHTGLGSSSLVAHILHYPPPPHANSFVLGPAVIKHTRVTGPPDRSGGPLVEMLVGRLFLVSGVVNTVFPLS